MMKVTAAGLSALVFACVSIEFRAVDERPLDPPRLGNWTTASGSDLEPLLESETGVVKLARMGAELIVLVPGRSDDAGDVVELGSVLGYAPDSHAAPRVVLRGLNQPYRLLVNESHLLVGTLDGVMLYDRSDESVRQVKVPGSILGGNAEWLVSRSLRGDRYSIYFHSLETGAVKEVVLPPDDSIHTGPDVACVDSPLETLYVVGSGEWSDLYVVDLERQTVDIPTDGRLFAGTCVFADGRLFIGGGDQRLTSYDVEDFVPLLHSGRGIDTPIQRRVFGTHQGRVVAYSDRAIEVFPIDSGEPTVLARWNVPENAVHEGTVIGDVAYFIDRYPTNGTGVYALDLTSRP